MARSLGRKENVSKIEKKSLILHGWERREQKIEEYKNGNSYLLWFSDKRRLPYNCLSLSDEDDSVSRTDNFVNVNVFNSGTSPRVRSYRCVLHYSLTMPVGFN